MNSEITKDSAWGVIFDMDGVLIDSYQSHLAAFRRMLANYNLTMSEKQFSTIFGRTNPDIFALLYPDFKPADYDRLSEEKEAAFREIIKDDFPQMDGAAELIEALHRAGADMGIGSSGSAENIQVLLQALPGAEHIKATTNAKEITHGKPHPEVFLTAAAKMDLPPEACVVVEDAPAGVAAGKAAGCAVIAITGTATRQELADADLVVESLRELTPAVFRDLLQVT